MGRYLELAERAGGRRPPAETRPRVAVKVRVLSWDQWRRERLDRIFAEPPEAAEPEAAEAYSAVCGVTQVWLSRSGSRWIMFADSGEGRERVRPFSSPWLGHAKRTAEAWFGPPRDGWQADEGSGRARP